MLAILTTLFLTACDKVVNFNPPSNITFTIKGDRASELYPVSVKSEGEDVRIELKKPAPELKISSLDASGRRMAFNFEVTGSAVILPGKFDHIELRGDGGATVDIFANPTH